MLVGVCKLDIFVPESGSLKAKRVVLNSVKKRIRNKFNVSVAEVEHQDKWQRISLGISMVTNERTFIDSTMSEILKLIDYDGRMEVLSHKVDIC
ncbi:MAG: DUF503 domain-containing protein [bacterium]